MSLVSKDVEYQNDLTVLGAKPVFEEALYVGRPNIGDRSEFFHRLEGIFDRRWLTNDGPLLKDFEAKVASYLGVKHCVAMCNGTVALEIAIRSLGLKGEVILPSYTFIATAHALQWQGITPVFADIDPKTHNLSPSSVRKKITSRTSGIIGVHLWGRGACHEELQTIAAEYDLKLMYDAAHAFGCSIGGTKIGGFGNCEVLSFHGTKFFNTFEGGAVVTNDNTLAQQLKLMRNFGFEGKDNVTSIGTNGKMSEVCAAMGLTNLDYIDTVIAANRANYKAYQKGIDNILGLDLCTYDEAECNNFQYIVLEVDNSFPLSRNEIIQVLHAENVIARRYFWPGCHAMQPYKKMFPDAGLALPNTVEVGERVIVMPTGTTVSLEQVELIIRILEYMSKPENADSIRQRLFERSKFPSKQLSSNSMTAVIPAVQ